MSGDPPSLWGHARFFEPCEEPELRAELARLEGAPSGESTLAWMQYVPPSRLAEPSFYTLEGDPVVFAVARWKVHDRSKVASSAPRRCLRSGSRRRSTSSIATSATLSGSGAGR